MRRNYYDYLERDYFGDLYRPVAASLTKGDSVCVSVLHGCGESVFLNFFTKLANEDKLFEATYFYDPESRKTDIVKFVKKIVKKDSSHKLFLIRLFETISEKRDILEKLQSLRQPDPFKNVFLVLTDHTGVTNPWEYFAKTSPFFPARFYISPFDLKETIRMMKVNEQFFGWKISPSLYKKIFALSGGIPRLTKHVSKEIYEEKTDLENLERLIKNPSIYFQLEYLTKIALSKNKEELKTLGILDKKGHFKSGLLDYYFKNLRVDVAHEIYPNLTKMESKVFSLLYENKNSLVTVDQVGNFLELSGHDFSLWAIYKLISRLKTKVDTNFEIENYKGRGYKLSLKS